MPTTEPPRPHALDLRCDCTVFGTPMIVIATWAANFFRREGADYECPNCGKAKRALLIPRFLFPDRLILKRR